MIFVLGQVRDDCLAEDASKLIDHEDRDKVDSKHDNIKLVDSDVEEIKLEVCELEYESLDEDRVVICALRLVVL